MLLFWSKIETMNTYQQDCQTDHCQLTPNSSQPLSSSHHIHTLPRAFSPRVSQDFVRLSSAYANGGEVRIRTDRVSHLHRSQICSGRMHTYVRLVSSRGIRRLTAYVYTDHAVANIFQMPAPSLSGKSLLPPTAYHSLPCLPYVREDCDLTGIN